MFVCVLREKLEVSILTVCTYLNPLLFFFFSFFFLFKEGKNVGDKRRRGKGVLTTNHYTPFN